MQALKFRVTLDHTQDIYRDIVLSPNNTLTQFHDAITKAFGFSGMEMAAFYESDKDWNRGNEIPLFDMMMDLEEDLSFSEIPSSMDAYTVEYGINQEVNNYVYVYDFLKMWCFYVEFVEELNETVENPTVVHSFGEAPNESTEKDIDMSEFTEVVGSKKEEEDEEEDEFGSMFDDFESFDENDYAY